MLFISIKEIYNYYYYTIFLWNSIGQNWLNEKQIDIYQLSAEGGRNIQWKREIINMTQTNRAHGQWSDKKLILR